MNKTIQLTDTIERYGVVAEANQRKLEVEDAWRKAAAAYCADKSTGNAVRLIQASNEMKKVNDQFHSVVRETFPPKGEIETNDTLKASLEDAGFGDFGPM